jgi:Ferritin-like
MAEERRDTRLADLTRRLETVAQPVLLEAQLDVGAATPQTRAADPAVLEALQLAIEIEISTLPPYLCALWSIKSGDGPVYGIILRICLNEMLHLGLACNMLTALGGKPDIKNAYYTNIKYPTNGLPGGVLPGLVVDLGSLTHDRVVKQFQVIETPEHEIPSALLADMPYTIGRFYDALAAALPADGWTAGKPVTDDFITPQITSKASAQAAIAKIKQQGEGTSALPYAEGTTLAHFYAFEEIARQNRITGTTGDPPTLVWADPPDPALQMPACYDMKPIDPGGRYLNPPAGVAANLQSFNVAWDKLLTDLDAAWVNDDLGTAVTDMFALKSAAEKLFSAQPVDPGQPDLRYGPEFMRPV